MRKFLYEAQIQSLHPPLEATELFDTDSDASEYAQKYCDIDIWKLLSLAEHCNLHSDYSITCGVISLLPFQFQGILKKHERDKIVIICTQA